MVIKNIGKNLFEIKSKDSTIAIGENVKINDFLISSPGEYEVKGVFVEVIDGIYNLNTEEINITCIFSKNNLSNEELEKIENTDILFISIGGDINTKNSLEIINQIEPKIVIPIINISMEEFNKLEGIKPEIQDVFKANKATLSAEENRKIIILQEKSSQA